VRSVPTPLVAPLIRRYVDGGGSLVDLARRSGLDERSIRQIREKRTLSVRPSVVDRLLVALDLVELWFVPAPDGLAEFYDDRAAA